MNKVASRCRPPHGLSTFAMACKECHGRTEQASQDPEEYLLTRINLQMQKLIADMPKCVPSV